jgi:hypothetical protein
MFSQLSKSDKKIVGALVKAGSEVYVCGSGWVVDNELFDSFEDFIEFCKLRASED